MSQLRQELRTRKTSCYLGDVLNRMGAIDEQQLARALDIQMESGRNKLLGEILVDLGWINETMLRHAVEEQAAVRGSVCEIASQPSTL
jgi:hypothetical protein